MKIGILQAGHAPPAMIEARGDYTQMYSEMLDQDTFTYQTWSVVDMEFPAGPEDADGWLISGSKHGAYEDHPFIPPLEQLIRDISASNRPLVGVCFGHQIIAQALGGTVEKFDGGWSVGQQNYDINGENMQLNAWHQDQVVTPPPDARTIASNDFCKHAVLAYKGRAISVQPHPEFQSSDVEMLLDLRAPGIVPSNLIADSRTKLDAPTDNSEMASRIAAFFKGTDHG